MKCWKCGETFEKRLMADHHINGNHADDRKNNRVRLCRSCHDFVQAICDVCLNQFDCYNIHFKDCYRIENAYPPVHFSAGEGPSLSGERVWFRTKHGVACYVLDEKRENGGGNKT